MPPFVSSPKLDPVQRASGLRMRTLLLTGACIAALALGQAHAGGVSGGKVVYGNASINYGANSTTISQSTGKALINWGSFSVASGSSVSFFQPNASSITLNRVLGSSPSVIDGSMFATGNVWLINSNGVLFGKGSQINVGGLIATTSDMRDSDFISGNYNFSVASPNPNASVVNQGTIRTARGGAAILAGSSVDNQGLIQADLGNVVLAGASTFSVDFTGDNLLRFAIVDPVKQTPANADGSTKAALVSNSGTISANGGHVLMTARAASNVVDNVVNNTGMIQATSVSEKDGEIILDAGDGTVEAGGKIDASGTATGETGGTVKVLAKTVEVADGATIDASGASGGGTVLIGGNFHGKGPEQNADTTTIGNATIKADALQKGDGGRVAVWSNKQTAFSGTISARGGAAGGQGGYVETSGGKLSVGSAAKVNTLAPHGKTGTWLLDPENIDIVDGGGDGLDGSNIDPGTIIKALADTNVELEATQNIAIDSAVIYSSANAFTLLSEGNINANASVQNSGVGAINLIAGWDGTTTDLGALTNPGVYGNNYGSAVIGGDSGRGDVAVGSLGGTTTVAGANVVVFAEYGAAQIGYHGAGQGDIDVLASMNVLVASVIGNTAQIGNGGRDVTGTIGGDISVTTNDGGEVLLEAASADYENRGIATIGNLGTGNSSESGNITINTGATGTFAAVASGLWDFAKVGNWNAGSSTGTASGNIEVDTGVLEVFAGLQDADSSLNFAGIGNGGFTSGANLGGVSGNITINAVTLALDAEGDTSGNNPAEARIGNLGYGTVTGDIDITTASDLTILSNGMSVASIGSVSAPSDDNQNPLQGELTGNLTIQSGGNISLVAENLGSARIESGGLASGTVSVTAAGNILLSAATTPDAAGSAFIGTFLSGNGGGDVTVISTHGSITLDENGEGGLAQIGNAQEGLAGQVSGDVAVTASDAEMGSITLSGQGGQVLIGNSGTEGSSVAGDTSVSAGTALNLAGAQTLIGNFNPGGPISGSVTINAAAIAGDPSAIILNELAIGDFALNLTGDATLILPFAVDYNSSHALTISNGGDIVFAGSLENLGTGDLTINAGGDVIVGGAAAQGGVAVGSFGGTTTVHATDIVLDASHGFAQIGFAGDGGTGAIDVSASHDVLIMAGQNEGCHACYAQIGNGGVLSGGDKSGDISVSAGNDITLAAGAEEYSYAQIGNGGDSASGKDTGSISVVAGATLTMTGSGDYATIGNGGWGTDNDTTGDIAVQAHDISMIGGDSPYGYVDIGNGGQDADGAATGDIAVTVSGNLTLAGGSGPDFVQIGNGAADGSFAGSAGGNITVTVGGATALSSAQGGQPWIGNFASGGEAGDLIFVSGSLDGDSEHLGAMFAADLGTGDDSGGNVTVGLTAESDTLIAGGVEYSSSHTLSILSTGNVVFLGSLQNDGSGAINVVAGWDGTTLDPGQFTATGVFGNNGGSITIGGAQAFGSVAVGSAGGATTLAASDVSLLANNGYAQVGYHGAGSGSITIDALGTVVLTGGEDQHYAQIGNGGSGVTGNEAGDIAITAGGDLVLTGGTGADAYAQIGHGGAEGNEKTNGYALAGNITIAADNLTLAAGTGHASYAQIGHGGFLSGSGLGGAATIGGEIDVNATGAVALTGNGDDAYAQIGNGGDQVNTGALAGSSAAIGGDVVVVAGGGVTLAAGSGANAYTQIGNGGFDINGSNGSNVDGFTIGGDVSVSDLTLTGGDTGNNAFAQVGNGDGSGGGFANVSGDITIDSSGKIVVTDGKAKNAKALIANAIGTGSVTGTVTGYKADDINPQNPVLNGVVATTIADNNPADLVLLTGNQEPVLVAEEPPAPTLVAQTETTAPAPLADLAGENVEGHTASDTLTLSVATSLMKSKPSLSRVLLGGTLREFPTLAGKTPRGVPPADQEFSSWGNEALWQ
jgi:filamentous hemagglutinin family protein